MGNHEWAHEDYLPAPLSDKAEFKEIYWFIISIYKRAYLNHLIATKELLAPILLTMHNTYSYSRSKFHSNFIDTYTQYFL